ncbi:hypothetical protein [Yinghuangia seranimata]|uniref:hypothetical protein n=1 Tax=Yinghuangia seranimata TaxID=408067 RepID=UPI00248BBCC6|nr:hypothetical protein [Yinghuangia seranimata]MDI2126004.1 hypothetical protein [Yinghuangia seranimata]
MALGVLALIVAALIDRGSFPSLGRHNRTAPAAATTATGPVAAPAPRPTGSALAAGPAPPAAPPAPAPRTATPQQTKGGVPDVVGRDLQKARDAVWSSGYHFIKTHDALGRGRTQLLLSNWQVCDQTPGPGKADKETTVRLGVVRTNEHCPTEPVPTTAPTAPDGIMPDVVGRSVNVVRDALRGIAKVDADDLRGNRPIIVENHWRVCTQNPPAGAPLPNDKVRLGAVKFDEKCP